MVFFLHYNFLNFVVIFLKLNTHHTPSIFLSKIRTLKTSAYTFIIFPAIIIFFLDKFLNSTVASAYEGVKQSKPSKKMKNFFLFIIQLGDSKFPRLESREREKNSTRLEVNPASSARAACTC